MNIQRLLFEIIGGALLLIAGVAYERHEGAKGCREADTKAATNQAIKVAQQTGAAAEIIKQEAQNYVEAISQPIVAPVVRVCPSKANSSPVLHPPSPSPLPDATPPLPQPARPDPQGRDIGQPIETVGLQADAQIAALQDYIIRVCRPTS